MSLPFFFRLEPSARLLPHPSSQPSHVARPHGVLCNPAVNRTFGDHSAQARDWTNDSRGGDDLRYRTTESYSLSDVCTLVQIKWTCQRKTNYMRAPADRDPVGILRIPVAMWMEFPASHLQNLNTRDAWPLRRPRYPRPQSPRLNTQCILESIQSPSQGQKYPIIIPLLYTPESLLEIGQFYHLNG